VLTNSGVFLGMKHVSRGTAGDGGAYSPSHRGAGQVLQKTGRDRLTPSTAVRLQDGRTAPLRTLGGLSNPLPELVHDAGLGATFELREVENADKGMSPLQIWCCKAQERYVMAMSEPGLKTFAAIAERERCGFSVVVGRAEGGGKADQRLVLKDRNNLNYPKIIDLPISHPGRHCFPSVCQKITKIRYSGSSRVISLSLVYAEIFVDSRYKARARVF